MRVLAFDPGQTTGYAILDSTQWPPVEDYGELSVPGLYRKIDEPEEWITVDLIVIEDYTIDPKMWTAHMHSRVPTLRVIGVLEYFAWKYKIKVQIQNRSIKNVGYGWLNLENKHIHWQDALVHGYYWLVKNKKMERKSLGIKAMKN